MADCECCGNEICEHRNVEDVTEAKNVVRCLDCGKAFRKPEVYSRVVGYLRPVSAYNLGKKQEFANRKVFKVKQGGK